MTTKLLKPSRDARVDGALPMPLENATGIMRDMSASGAFFWISGAHAVGQTITFSIELKAGSGRMAWMCQGEVVRTEMRGIDLGVAVRITRTWVEPVWR